MFSSEKKANQLQNFLALSSQKSPSINDIGRNSGFSVSKMKDGIQRASWRQMLTPHCLNDITDFNTNQTHTHNNLINMSRPSNQSPIQRILGTDNSSKQEDQLKTQDYYYLDNENANLPEILITQESQHQFSNYSHRTKSQDQHLLSAGSNMRSLLQTIKENEMQFFQELESKYFKKAQKIKSQSQSGDLNFQSQKSDSQKSQRKSASSQQIQKASSEEELKYPQHEHKNTYFSLNDYFNNFNDNRNPNHDFQNDNSENQKVLQLQEAIQKAAGSGHQRILSSRLFSDLHLSPQPDSSNQTSSMSSPPMTSQNLMCSNMTSSQQDDRRKPSFKLQLQQVIKDQNQYLRNDNKENINNTNKINDKDEENILENSEDILLTYRENCELARNMVHSTFNNTIKSSTLTSDRAPNLIILSKSENSSHTFSPDVYQTAKWNNLNSIESFQQTKQFSLIDDSNQKKPESQNISVQPESQPLTQRSLKSREVNHHHKFLYEENHELKSYLRRAYQCVLKFLNQYDINDLQNTDLAQELQVFAELEQKRKDLLSEQQYVQNQQSYQDSTNQSQQQTYQVENVEYEQPYEQTPCSSIETNLSGIKKNLKETKKSLLQAKKLIFQEKCINIDHDKQILDIKQQMNDLQSQLKFIESQTMTSIQQIPLSFNGSPDHKFNMTSAFRNSPPTHLQTTQCTNCMSKSAFSKVSKQPMISPIQMGTFSSNTNHIFQNHNNHNQQDLNSHNDYDSFITFKEDEQYEGCQQYHQEEQEQQKEEYSFLRDEAEQLMSQQFERLQTLSPRSVSKTQEKQSSQISYVQGQNFLSNAKNSKPTKSLLTDPLAQMNQRLRSQVETNLQTFSQIKQELTQKDLQIQQSLDKISSQHQQIHSLQSQLQSTHQTIQQLLDSQRDQEDLYLEQIQKYNQAEEELLTIKKHYHESQLQVQYFKNKYESFVFKSGQEQEILSHRQSTQKDLMMSTRSNDVVSTKNTDTQQNKNEILLLTDSKQSDKQLFKQAGLIHHQKRTTASFVSPSEFKYPDQMIQQSPYDNNEISNSDSQYQSERLQRFQEMRTLLNQKFGRMSQIMEEYPQPNNNHQQHLNANQYIQNQYNSRLSAIDTNNNSQMRVLSATDLELLASINGQENLRQQYQASQRESNRLSRRSPTMIIHEVPYDQGFLPPTEFTLNQDYSSNNNFDNTKLHNSSFLKYSGDTFKSLQSATVNQDLIDKRIIDQPFQQPIVHKQSSLPLPQQQQSIKPSLKQSLSSKFNSFFKKKQEKQTIVDVAPRTDFFENESTYKATDLKKCVIELAICGIIKDKYNKADGIQFEIKIGEEIIAKWFEINLDSRQVVKKIRFPFKFNDKQNVFQMSIDERRFSHNITIKFILQLPFKLVSLLDDNHTLKVFEDQGMYTSKIQIVQKYQVNDLSLEIVLCIPNYEELQFKDRMFIIQFEQKFENEDKYFMTPPQFIKGMINITGSEIQQLEKGPEIKDKKKLSNQQVESKLRVIQYKTEESKEKEVKKTYMNFREIIDVQNPYLTMPRIFKPVLNHEMTDLGSTLLYGPIESECYTSLVDYINQSQLQVVPIIALDFSLANLTFSEDQCLHSTKTDKQNDYKEIIQAIGDSYSNVFNIPIFGFSAKTTPKAQKAADYFPLSQDLRNPFITNHPDIIDECYTKCLKELELSTPINLTPFFQFIKNLGQSMKQHIKDNDNKVDSVYVLYILSAGLIDDLADLLDSIDSEWQGMPIQVHLINLSATNIVADDLDTIKFQDFTLKYNLQKACWLQFNVHFYDRIKAQFKSGMAIQQLKEACIDSVPKEIESFLFLNQAKPNKFCSKAEAVQLSLMTIINALEDKTTQLFKQAEEMGVDKQILHEMISMRRLFEWELDTLQALISNQNTNNEKGL